MKKTRFLDAQGKKIASGNVVALAMTAEERHCESEVTDVDFFSVIASAAKQSLHLVLL